MLFYNLFIFLSVKSPAYFYYVLYVGTFGLEPNDHFRLSFEYLWPESIFCSALDCLYASSQHKLPSVFHHFHFAHQAPCPTALHRIQMVGATRIGRSRNAAMCQLCLGRTRYRSGVFAAVLLSVVAGYQCMRRTTQPPNCIWWGGRGFCRHHFLPALYQWPCSTKLCRTVWHADRARFFEVLLFSFGLAARLNQERNAKMKAESRRWPCPNWRHKSSKKPPGINFSRN